MNAVQKLKHLILIRGSIIYDLDLPDINASNIDEVYSMFCDTNPDAIQDSKQEVRENVYETDIEPKVFSRNYEVYVGATQYLDGTFVAWPVFHGGGKHSEPEYAYDWVNNAFDVNARAETVVKYFFTEKKEVSQEK